MVELWEKKRVGGWAYVGGEGMTAAPVCTLASGRDMWAGLDPNPAVKTSV